MCGSTDTVDRLLARVLKETVPSTTAKIVWSTPMPSPEPGCHWVPRWRIMMLPAMTFSAPNFLTPSRRPAVSRPLRDEPPAFLCAILLGSLFLLAGLGHGFVCCRLLGLG